MVSKPLFSLWFLLSRPMLPSPFSVPLSILPDPNRDTHTKRHLSLSFINTSTPNYHRHVAPVYDLSLFFPSFFSPSVGYLFVCTVWFLRPSSPQSRSISFRFQVHWLWSSPSSCLEQSQSYLRLTIIPLKCLIFDRKSEGRYFAGLLSTGGWTKWWAGRTARAG